MMYRYLAIAFALPVSAMSSIPSIAADLEAAHVVVEGPAQGVFEFHKNLKEIMAAMVVEEDLGTAAVACNIQTGEGFKTCDELANRRNQGGTVKTVYIIFRDQTRLTAFVAAWSKLQAQSPANDVALKFDMKDIVQADCLVPSFANQPCVNAPFCPNTTPKRCDKASGPPCTSCGVP